MSDPKTVVLRRDLKPVTRNFFLQQLAGISIFGAAFSIIICHLSLELYQQIYFSVYKIPKIDSRKFIIIEKHKLKKLNLGQKISCLYCEYANGVANWAKILAAQTEIYSCAIKHSYTVPGQDHESGYFEYKEFE